eukprot:3914479-Prymnesium_polylepis.2
MHGDRCTVTGARWAMRARGWTCAVGRAHVARRDVARRLRFPLGVGVVMLARRVGNARVVRGRALDLRRVAVAKKGVAQRRGSRARHADAAHDDVHKAALRYERRCPQAVGTRHVATGQGGGHWDEEPARGGVSPPGAPQLASAEGSALGCLTRLATQ